jgi:hypothetical protein
MNSGEVLPAHPSHLVPPGSEGYMPPSGSIDSRYGFHAGMSPTLEHLKSKQFFPSNPPGSLSHNPRLQSNSTNLQPMNLDPRLAQYSQASSQAGPSRLPPPVTRPSIQWGPSTTHYLSNVSTNSLENNENTDDHVTGTSNGLVFSFKLVI